MFRSSKHEIRTIKVNNIALNRNDDKKISGRDGISTFARGHKDLSWSPIFRELSLILNAKFFALYKMPQSNFK